MEGEVEASVAYSVVEPKYEFSAPQYFDFSYEETQEDIDLAESWFRSAIPYEASRKTLTCLRLFVLATDESIALEKSNVKPWWWLNLWIVSTADLRLWISTVFSSIWRFGTLCCISWGSSWRLHLSVIWNLAFLLIRHVHTTGLRIEYT